MFLEPSLGLSYDFEPYNPETNVHNDAIGSRFNVYFALNLGAAYRLNREMDLVYGLDLTHFSNGRTFRPNKGLNLAGLNLGFRYHFNKPHHFYGTHLGYDYSFWLLSFRMQAGTYLHSRGHDYKGAYFFRPALQLRPGKSWFVQVGLKTQAGFKADWVEYGLGLRLPR